MKFDYETPFSCIENKTGKHKDWYGPDFVKIFCGQTNSEETYFNNSRFLAKYKKNYKKLELKQRLNLIVEIFNELCSKSFEDKLKILEKLLGAKLPYEEGMFTLCFHLYPVSHL